MMPVCIVQNIAHPQRKPIAGEKARVRYTYTPPVDGSADASSAAMSDPPNVRSPASSQTTMMPTTDGTAPVTVDGCTKIDAPMIVPTTIAVARVGPIVRRSSVSIAVIPRSEATRDLRASRADPWSYLESLALGARSCSSRHMEQERAHRARDSQ